MFVSSEHRQRSTWFDTTLNNVTEAINKPIRPIEPSTLERVMRALSLVYLPNIRHDEINLSKSTKNTEKVAVVPLHKESCGIKVDRALLLPTPQQTQRIANYYQAKHLALNARRIQGGTKDILRKGDPPTLPTPFDTRPATTHRIKVSMNNNRIHFIGRPVVVMANWLGSNLDTLTLGHELVHVDQVLQAPFHSANIMDTSSEISMELEAFHLSAALADDESFTGRHYLSNQVEYFRCAHVEADAPFTPTPSMIDSLKDFPFAYALGVNQQL